MKLEARRLQQLVRQRERLEEELARTEEEAEALVNPHHYPLRFNAKLSIQELKVFHP
jgi:hypothetical protein